MSNEQRCEECKVQGMHFMECSKHDETTCPACKDMAEDRAYQLNKEFDKFNRGTE